MTYIAYIMTYYDIYYDILSCAYVIYGLVFTTCEVNIAYILCNLIDDDDCDYPVGTLRSTTL